MESVLCIVLFCNFSANLALCCDNIFQYVKNKLFFLIPYRNIFYSRYKIKTVPSVL